MKSKNIRGLLIVLSVALVSACSANYEVGDLSKAYCGSTSPEFRATIKSDLAANNISIGVDYCSVHGLIDAMGVYETSVNKALNVAAVASIDVEGVEDIERQVDLISINATGPKSLVANLAKKQNQNFERMA